MKSSSRIPPSFTLSSTLINTVRHQNEMSKDDLIKTLVRERRMATATLHMMGFLMVFASASATATLAVILNNSNLGNIFLGFFGLLLVAWAGACLIQLLICATQRQLLAEDIQEIDNGGKGVYLSRLTKIVKEYDEYLSENR